MKTNLKMTVNDYDLVNKDTGVTEKKTNASLKLEIKGDKNEVWSLINDIDALIDQHHAVEPETPVEPEEPDETETI